MVQIIYNYPLWAWVGFPHQFNHCAYHSSLKGCSIDHQPDNIEEPFQCAGNCFISFKPQVFKSDVFRLTHFSLLHIWAYE